MLNICVRKVWRYQPIKQTYRILSLQNYATFTVRDILYETSDEAGTLLTRFAKHVALERQKICDQVPNKVKYSDYFPLNDMRYFQKELQKTDVEQLAAVIIFAFTYRSNADPGKFAIVLNELDRLAANNVEKMNTDTILRTLYAFLFLLPNWMTRLDFYGRAMQRLHDDFNKQEGKSKEQFVQMCFYMGLNKKQTKFNVTKLISSLLEAHLGQHINEMSTLDLALVSNAAYKTSTVIENDAFNQRLLREVLDTFNNLKENDAILVTFIKSMRLQRLRSAKVCECIEEICQDAEKLQKFQTRGHVHLFAYLAENLWDSNHSTQSLIETITKQLTLSRKSNGYSQAIRAKDICTFLWSCAQINCSLSSIQFRTIENSLLEKLDDGEFKYFPDQLVDSCLSLWILGYKTRELFQAAVKLKSESTSKYKQPKVDSRLTVLLSAVQIEEPVWCSAVTKGFEAFNLKAKVPPYLSNQDDISYQKIIEHLLKEETVSSADISCPIKGINIPGIHIKLSSSSESQVFVEFMTPTQTLHFSQQPVAILRLKIRLLQSLGHKVKVVSSTDVLNSQALKEALSDSDVHEELIKEPSENSIKA